MGKVLKNLLQLHEALEGDPELQEAIVYVAFAEASSEILRDPCGAETVYNMAREAFNSAIDKRTSKLSA